MPGMRKGLHCWGGNRRSGLLRGWLEGVDRPGRPSGCGARPDGPGLGGSRRRVWTGSCGAGRGVQRLKNFWMARMTSTNRSTSSKVL